MTIEENILKTIRDACEKLKSVEDTKEIPTLSTKIILLLDKYESDKTKRARVTLKR